MPPPNYVPSIASILLSPEPTPPTPSTIPTPSTVTVHDQAMDSPTNVNASDATSPDNRPPGGTRRTGAKTPRRVQWMFDEPQETSSTRALDEHGLDVCRALLLLWL